MRHRSGWIVASLISLALLLTACASRRDVTPLPTIALQPIVTSTPDRAAALADSSPTVQAITSPTSLPPTPTAIWAATPTPLPTATPSPLPPSPTALPATPTTVPLTLTPAATAPTTPAANPSAGPTAPAGASDALDPSVIAAAKAFRALIPSSGQLSADEAAKAQTALETAGNAFVTSGDAASATLRQQLADQLTPDRNAPAVVQSVDLDGNGRPELLIAVPAPGLRPIIFPDSQPAWKLLLPDADQPTAYDTITDIAQIHDFAGQGKPDVVVTRVNEGASAITTEIMVLRWDGSAAQVLFDQTIDNGAGSATWQIQQDGAIELGCPAFGIYDHKLLPHPRQTRLYRWNGSAFALASRQTAAPTTRREMMNLAEADFFAGDWNQAARRYEEVIEDPTLGTDPGDRVDWQNFARLRLGELAALEGNQPEADHWLSLAAQASPPLGDIARAFQSAARGGNAAAGFAAIQQSALPRRFDDGNMGNLDFPVRLGPFAALGEGVADALDHLPSSGNLSAQSVTAALNQVGFQVKDLTVADLDGDGAPEIAMILPFGSQEQTLWLFVQSGNRWRAIATVEAPDGLGGVQTLANQRQALKVIGPSGSTPPATFLTWDGHTVGLASGPDATPVPVVTNFVTAGAACVVQEDYPAG